MDPLQKERDDGGCMVALIPSSSEASKIAVDGGEPADKLHITVAYLGKARDVDEERVNRVVAGWSAGHEPVTAELTGSTSTFGNRHGEDPAQVALVSVPQLDDTRATLVRLLTKVGHPPATDYGFNPHMTLAYRDEPLDSVRQRKLKFSSVAVVHSGRVTEHEFSGVAKATGAVEDMLKVRGVIPNKPGVKNWVEAAGGLPAYIDDVAGALYTKRGFSVSHAIATAVNKMKKWARGGDGVTKKTQAKAAKALAQWEKMRTKANAKRVSKAYEEEDPLHVETTIEEVEAVLALGVDLRNEILREDH